MEKVVFYYTKLYRLLIIDSQKVLRTTVKKGLICHIWPNKDQPGKPVFNIQLPAGPG